ncbi:MAG: glycosyltransferase family 4 protein [Muribaculaceae bacterium]|nr:glycosyltransferase family 4 protein [Muribaculaceae bacterium]
MSITIGFDAKRAVANMTGLGNYSRFVIEALAERRPDIHLRLYTPRMHENARLHHINILPNVVYGFPTGNFSRGSLWRSWGITKQLKLDGVTLYHGLSNELPLNIASSGIRTVLTMHDVIYRRLPECYNPVDRKIYDFKYGRSCRIADRIIAVSQRTKDDVTELYGVDPDRIDVVYQGCDAAFRRMRTDIEKRETAHRLKLPDRFLLQVGTVERRKNLELTIRALSLLPEDVHLVIVGHDNNGYKAYCTHLAEQLRVVERIVWLEALDFVDLPTLGQMAEVICYPSRYEGFGIPVLEGLESRRPVVAATGSCLEEAGGEAAYYVDPNDVRGMAIVLNQLLRDGVPEGRIEAGLRHAARFSNDNVADGILATYARLFPSLIE